MSNNVLLSLFRRIKTKRFSSWLNLGAPSSFFILVAVVLAIGGVFAAAINLGRWIELGSAVRDTNNCSRSSTVSIDQNFSVTVSGTASRVTRVTVANIPTNCAGQWLKVNLLNSTNQILDSVVWELVRVQNSDNSISAIADGITTGSHSSANVSRVFPSTETGTRGLALDTVDPQQIFRINLESSTNQLSED